jgi:hypothetical protein
MPGGAVPDEFAGRREFVYGVEVKALRVGMIVREHVDIGPAYGAGGDDKDLARLARLLLGHMRRHVDGADKGLIGFVGGMRIAPPVAGNEGCGK